MVNMQEVSPLTGKHYKLNNNKKYLTAMSLRTINYCLWYFKVQKNVPVNLEH